ncbi:PREDICTED: WEB family protein At3g13190-like [Camelina sativa]|uniref:WEB family protein At3g13190-like n=1 Tax=Camelina sativa TaxID=90675 RepID=A0ABM0W3E2_CAMSA|nr:PREDICTED: WEB family protein At3g13190-like [Camelina sativa]XP_010465131.1 PREDICTED: WEB family protein At3g13190-like [Camelina sativa]XP_010465132.1 PREDICTED: WEB family protein At3g13190-like [Camelina sativa]XP_010465133.1 PREDICTED: WEB family protein At3g13190-like [Camelina sativa]XP_010465134.1 PREDICTED: WEB family protein At3g13190-like [Camelina sativa]XP_019092204.1 PREDICTED: WEB family protein At3g13190-like [Camelina sativa]
MATFHTVKDAVKLFDAGFSGGKPLNKRKEQGVLVEETNLCFWNREVNKLKEKIKNAEKTKIEALLELEEAKKTVEHLSQKLGIKQNVRSGEKDLDLSTSVRGVTTELGFAKESIHRVAEEESELCLLMESLNPELQKVEKEHSELKESEQRERDQAIEKLKKETKDAKTELKLLEEELKIAVFEAQEAEAAEKHAREQLNVAVLQSDFRSSSAEVKESGTEELTETEALRACRDETLKTLEMSEREIEDIKAATQDALKKAEMAQEATNVVDVELKRRRKAASRIWAESKMCAKSTKEVLKSKPRSSSKEGCLVKC